MAWNIEKTNGFDELKTKLLKKSDKQFAFRGQGDCTWALRSVFDRGILPETPYADLLKKERKLLHDFAEKARRLLSARERLTIDGYHDQPTGPHIWGVMAMARHHGLATRALDWTSSVFVAAYFAAIDESEKDGAIWWFDQSELEGLLHRSWEGWDVPKRHGDPHGERAIENRAFQEDYNHCWVTKIHFPVPFPRMEAQRAFLTICSRLGVDHCQAIDSLSPEKECNIERGKIVIPYTQKGALLDYLENTGISAHSLLYPGADLVAERINQSATSMASVLEPSHRSNAPVVAEALREGA